MEANNIKRDAANSQKANVVLFLKKREPRTFHLFFIFEMTSISDISRIFISHHHIIFIHINNKISSSLEIVIRKCVFFLFCLEVHHIKQKNVFFIYLVLLFYRLAI